MNTVAFRLGMNGHQLREQSNERGARYCALTRIA